jgi:hypothetical protein
MDYKKPTVSTLNGAGAQPLGLLLIGSVTQIILVAPAVIVAVAVA